MDERAPEEGVIKFRARHREERLPVSRFGALAAQLSSWREILACLDVLGEDPARYGGAGFGNVSGRIGPFPGARGARPFLITGTQTGGKRCVTLDDYCVVTRYDVSANAVDSHGAVLPSSESLTHGALYDLAPHIRFVLHAHAPLLFRRARALRLPTTSPAVAYGTPEMADEVQRLYRETALSELQVLAMSGHEDGVVTFGRSADEAGQVFLRYLARAFEAACAERGELCRGDAALKSR